MITRLFERRPRNPHDPRRHGRNRPIDDDDGMRPIRRTARETFCLHAPKSDAKNRDTYPR